MALARNDLIVGIQSLCSTNAIRSVSPVMNVSMKEEYELKDLNRTIGGISRNEVESQADSYTNLNLAPSKDPQAIRTINVSSNRMTFRVGGGTDGNYSDVNEENRDTRMSFGSDQTTDISIFAGSAMSGDTVSHTSVGNDENYESDDIGDEMDDITLEYYCVDHVQLCSTKVIQEHHKDCENVVSAVEWAEEQQIERERKSTESMLQKFDTFAGIMIDERKDLKRYLTERKDDVTEEALEIMEDLVTHLLKKQKEFTEKFEELHESKMKIISDQIKRCTMVQRETSTCMKQLLVSLMTDLNRSITVQFIQNSTLNRVNASNVSGI